MISNALLICFAIVFTYITWTVFHELSHAAIVYLIGAGKNLKLKLLPHMYKGTFRIAAMEWTATRGLSKGELIALYLAPRVMDVAAAIALQFLTFSMSPFSIPLQIFLIGGIVDLLWGSIGKSQYSDLVRASYYVDISPWYLRIGGFLIAIAAIAGYLYPPC